MMKTLITLEMAALSRLILIALMTIMLNFVVLYSRTVLWAVCVILFKDLSVGEGCMNEPGLMVKCLTCAPLLRTVLLACESSGLIVSIVIPRFLVARPTLNRLTKADPFIFGIFARLT